MLDKGHFICYNIKAFSRAQKNLVNQEKKVLDKEF